MFTGKQLGAAALLVATFAVGAVTGRASSRWYPGNRERPRTERSDRRGGPSGPSDRGPGSGSRGFVATLERELNLTPVQKDTVQAILKRWEPAMEGVWNKMREDSRPKFDSLRAQVRGDIMRVLNDEQKAAFERWSARADSVARKREKERNRAR